MTCFQVVRPRDDLHGLLFAGAGDAVAPVKELTTLLPV